jgi:hypothetical protein
LFALGLGGLGVGCRGLVGAYLLMILVVLLAGMFCPSTKGNLLRIKLAAGGVSRSSTKGDLRHIKSVTLRSTDFRESPVSAKRPGSERAASAAVRARAPTRASVCYENWRVSCHQAAVLKK